MSQNAEKWPSGAPVTPAWRGSWGHSSSSTRSWCTTQCLGLQPRKSQTPTQKLCVNTEGAAVQGDSVTVLPLLPLAYVAATHGSWDGCIPLALGDIWKYSSQGLYGILSQTSCSCANMTVNQSSKPLNSGHHMVHWVLLFAKSCMPESLLERRHPSGLLLEVKWFLAAAHSH